MKKINLTLKKKSSFTLLEVIVAFSLLLIACGSVGWKMYQVIEKRRFQSDLEQLRSRFFTCHSLALNMQADWKGLLHLVKGKWVFEATCFEHATKKTLPPIVLHSFVLSFKGEVQDFLLIDFFSSGAISPQGDLIFYQDPSDPKTRKEIWKLPDILQFQEGNGSKELGPMHPDDF